MLEPTRYSYSDIVTCTYVTKVYVEQQFSDDHVCSWKVCKTTIKQKDVCNFCCYSELATYITARHVFLTATRQRPQSVAQWLWTCDVETLLVWSLLAYNVYLISARPRLFFTRTAKTTGKISNTKSDALMPLKMSLNLHYPRSLQQP